MNVDVASILAFLASQAETLDAGPAIWIAVVALWLRGATVAGAQRRRLKRLESELGEAQLQMAQLERRIIDLDDQGHAAASRFQQVTSALSELRSGQHQLQARGVANRSFDRANRLARTGAEVESLVELCGLSRGEAQLVADLNRAPRQESADG